MKLADPALFSLGIHPYGKERETMNLRFRKLTAAIVSLLVAISSVSPVFAAEADEIPDAESTSYSAAAPQSNEEEISPFSTGTTYYVAANGSDDNSGTIDAPLKTSTAAAAKLQPGDTLIFREGTYNGVMVFQGRGSSNEEPITIKACEGENVTLTSDNGQYVIFIGHSQNIVIEGLTFSGKNGEKRGNGIDIVNFDASMQQTRDITVRSCTFIDCEPAFIVRDVIENNETDMKFANMIFENNLIGSSDPDSKIGKGISLQEMRIADGSVGVIRNNVILNAKWSLYMWGRSENVLVYNNTFLDTYDKNEGGHYDIYPIQGAYNKTIYQPGISYNCVFKNNIFTKPIRTQLENGATLLDEDKGNVFDYNLYDASSLTDYVTYNYGGEGPKLTFEELQAFKSLNFEAHGKYAPVSFVDRKTDAHLSGATNPAISGAADSITDSVNAPAKDAEGKARTGEFGAYAYAASLVFVGANEGAGTGAADDPYPSISAAITAGAKEIQVKAGTYEEGFLSIPAGVSLKPYRNDEVTVTGTVSANGTEEAPTLISGITFTDRTLALTTVAFSNCTFEGPLELMGKDPSVASSAIKGGITAQNTGCTVKNCLILSAATGLTAKDGSKVFLVNNTFYSNDKDLSVEAGCTVNAYNNIFSSESTVSGTLNADYNCYSDSLPSDYLNTITEAHSIQADPQFINVRAGDFRLYRQSPCAAAGDSSKAPASDLSGATRSTPPAIGAYEPSDVKNVYYVSPDGDDTAAGTESAPFQTLSAAVSAVRPGEEVVILDGTYTEDVTIINKSVYKTDGCVIRTAGKNAVLNGTLSIGSCEGLTISGLTVTGTLNVQDSSDVNFNGLILKNGADFENSTVIASDLTVTGKGVTVAAGSLNLTRTKISGVDIAIHSTQKSTLTLTASQIVDCTTGVMSEGDSPLHVVNNTFYNVEGYSVDVSQQNSRDIDLDLYNNIYARASRTDKPFIRVNKAYGFNTENNIYDADSDQVIGTILTSDAEDAPMEDRDLSAMQNGGDDTVSVTADPMLRDPENGDFSPKKGSPAARKGRADANAPAYDFNGTRFASTPDIGTVYSPFTLRTFNVVPYGLGWGNYGDSSNPILPDGSWDHPFTSLKDALKVVGSSDTILIHKGVYDWGRMDLNDLHGAPDAPITIESCTNEGCWYCTSYDNRSFSGCPADAPALDLPVLTGSQKYSYADPSINAPAELSMKLTNCSYITIRGLEIAGFTGAGIWVYGGNHIVIEDNRIWNIDSKAETNSGVEGLLLNDLSDSEIRNNRIWNIGYTRKSHADHGIYVGGVKNCTFSENVIVNSPGGGMQFYAGDGYSTHGEDCTIENNVFYRARMGLILCGIKGFNIVNNTFVDSTEDDLYLDWTVQNNRFANNLFYNSLTSETTGLGKNPCIIARHNGAGENKVIGNTFANNLYDYCGHTPYAQEGWGNLQTFESFLAEQASTNVFDNFFSGKAGFLKAAADVNLSDYELAAQIDEELFRTTLQSAGVDKGTSESAPTADRDGNVRTGSPDIGAYEAQDVRALVLDNDQLEENNEIGAVIGSFSILGQDAADGDTYTLVDGEGSDDIASFSIEGNALKANVSFDYETKTNYTIRVKADCGGYTEEKVFTIHVVNVEEPAAADHWITLIDEPITPDGKLDEAAWADGSFTELLVGQDNATELKASIGLLADKTALYLAAKVTDSELSNDLVPGVDFAADMVELYLDGLNLESSAYDASTVQFQFRWNDEKLWIYGNSKTFDNTKFAMVATDDGYVLEVVIPWADLGIEFNPDHTIGLTADVQDYDSSTKEYKSVAMIEGAGFWNNSSAWESYGFKEKSSPEESVITPSKPAASGWQKASDGSWSYYRSGKRVTGWLLDNGCWYHLDKDGIMDTGWLTDNGSTYYLRSWGGMIVGWFKLNDTWYFADRSGAVKDRSNPFGDTVFSYGPADHSGTWLKDVKGQWAFEENGTLAIGWRCIDNVWYFFGTDHVMRTNWQRINDLWYFFPASGKMTTGWKEIDGKWYFFRSFGGMLTNATTPDGYKVDKDGTWIE